MAENTLFCPIYDKHLRDMLAIKNSAKSDYEKLKILTDFAAKFMILPEEFYELQRLSKKSHQTVEIDKYIFFYSFYYGDQNAKHILWSNMRKFAEKLQDNNCQNRFKIADEALSFPHEQLDELYEKRLHYSVAPVSKKIVEQYKTSKKLYDEIMKDENDLEKWLECIKKIDNKEAVIANLELKLGQGINWKCQKLWKFYFNFLKENNRKEILELFRKYTRLYVSDKQVVEDYRNEIAKYSTSDQPQVKYWIDTIKYEIEFGKLEFAYRIFERALKAVMEKTNHFLVKGRNDLNIKLKTLERELMKHERSQQILKAPICSNVEDAGSKKVIANCENPKLQYFCFHQSFMQNLLKNVNGIVLRKLYSTCKFFYSLQKAPLCYRLEICHDKKTRYCEESLYLNKNDINFAGLQNLHIYEIFDVGICRSKNVVSKVIPKIQQCTAKYINIFLQNITLVELKMLMSKWLIKITLLFVNICENGTIIDGKVFNDIFGICPDIQDIEHLSRKHLTCRSCNHTNASKQWSRLLAIMNSELETIYYENQICQITDLQKIINFDMLKSITLKNVIIKDENSLTMDNHQIREFVKGAVDPIKNITVTIL